MQYACEHMFDIFANCIWGHDMRSYEVHMKFLRIFYGDHIKYKQVS